jgi:hypothetical protein
MGSQDSKIMGRGDSTLTGGVQQPPPQFYGAFGTGNPLGPPNVDPRFGGPGGQSRDFNTYGRPGFPQYNQQGPGFNGAFANGAASNPISQVTPFPDNQRRGPPSTGSNGVAKSKASGKVITADFPADSVPVTGNGYLYQVYYSDSDCTVPQSGSAYRLNGCLPHIAAFQNVTAAYNADTGMLYYNIAYSKDAKCTQSSNWAYNQNSATTANSCNNGMKTGTVSSYSELAPIFGDGHFQRYV